SKGHAQADSAGLPAWTAFQAFGARLAHKLVLSGLEQSGGPPGADPEDAWCADFQPARLASASRVAGVRGPDAVIPLQIPLSKLRLPGRVERRRRLLARLPRRLLGYGHTPDTQFGRTSPQPKISPTTLRVLKARIADVEGRLQP